MLGRGATTQTLVGSVGGALLVVICAQQASGVPAAGAPTPPTTPSTQPATSQQEPVAPHPGYPRPKVNGAKLEIVSVSPQTATYGVGIIVTVRFNRPVPWALRKAVASRLQVKSSKKLGKSGWAWRDSQTVLFRPRKFWPGNAKVTVVAQPDLAVLGRVAKASGKGDEQLRWAGSSNHSFRTGRSQVITVNAKTDRAVVVREGKTIRTMGVSLGKPGWDTRSGIKVLMDKYYVKRMTSESIGAEEEYVLDVPYAIRLTDSGEFMHAAPWATGRIGRWNGSHGCTNLFTSDAQWLYNSRLYGDPVITHGTNRYMTNDNGMGGPWNVDWDLWKSGRLD